MIVEPIINLLLDPHLYHRQEQYHNQHHACRYRDRTEAMRKTLIRRPPAPLCAPGFPPDVQKWGGIWKAEPRCHQARRLRKSSTCDLGKQSGRYNSIFNLENYNYRLLDDCTHLIVRVKGTMHLQSLI